MGKYIHMIITCGMPEYILDPNPMGNGPGTCPLQHCYKVTNHNGLKRQTFQ
uniref:Uncharacterized protein n=1 Tax=Oryza sativa subsp. japonica TaxID=39947 RepID=Q6Z420_ORYSJ|nr:hypothetical protein [Oryza sativa Japonica Group]BAD38041.1 hypothetical protein [Oryza sativa Japonica Group]